jgi:hypothetical protein
MKKLPVFLLAAFCAASFAGCGYATHSAAYKKTTKIYIKPFENKVDLNINTEYSDRNPYRLYRAGMETKITDAIINRFLVDGYLKVVSKQDDADLVLSGALVNFDKQPLRYDQRSENVDEYRANIVVDMSLEDATQNKKVWSEKGFVGFFEYNQTGLNSVSEDAAITNAIADLAKRIVERTVEDW